MAPHVLAVELGERVLVIRRIEALLRLADPDGTLGGVRQGRYEMARIALPRRDVQRGTRQREAGHVIRVRPIVLDGQDRSPRVTDEVHGPESERRAQRVELAHEVGDREQRRVTDAIGFAATQLVVPDDRSIGAERLEWLEIEAAVPGSAVHENDRRPLPRTALAIPDAPIGHIQVCFARGRTRLCNRCRRVRGRRAEIRNEAAREIRREPSRVPDHEERGENQRNDDGLTAARHSFSR